jgi:hypothetical protein
MGRQTIVDDQHVTGTRRDAPQAALEGFVERRQRVALLGTFGCHQLEIVTIAIGADWLNRDGVAPTTKRLI